ncbi:hypothetical protein WOLCODRAFT_127533, partial [Wolfiporia cocos MD-104 SS10]
MEETKRDQRQKQLELRTLDRIHKETLTLLETRTADLHDAQVYLTKTDYVSDAEVVAMVEQLNAKIFQAASHIADSIDFESVVQHSIPQATEKATERATALVGEALVGYLQLARHRDDSFCLQLALQAGMVAFSSWIATTWTFVQDKGKVTFDRVYAQMRSSESQTVAGRWRILARQHARRVLYEDDEVTPYLTKCLARRIVDIFAVSGLQFEGAEDASRTFVSTTHGDRLKSLVESCLQLRRIMGEEVISGDFETIVVAPGEKFDEAHSTDGYANLEDDSPSAMDRQVLCTTAMGLQRVVQVGNTDTEYALHTTILLKPTVALETLGPELC